MRATLMVLVLVRARARWVLSADATFSVLFDSIL